VCDARAWTGETNGSRGRKNRSASGNSVLKGSGGEGAGRVGAAWRWSGRERGRGGAWARCRTSRWRGSGPTAVRAGGVLPRDSGGRRGRRDAGRGG
jgi:hypothetical protein